MGLKKYSLDDYVLLFTEHERTNIVHGFKPHSLSLRCVKKWKSYFWKLAEFESACHSVCYVGWRNLEKKQEGTKKELI